MIRPTWMAGGIAVLALVLAAVALPLASPAAVLAAGSLALFLLWQGWRFERNLAAAAASLDVTREVDRTILRQGAVVAVRVKADCAVPAGMTVRVRDLPPAVAAGDAPLSPPGETVTYTVRLMAPGETAFPGVVLSASDTFFACDLTCRRFDAPHLRVFPVGLPEACRGIGIRGEETEVNRKAALTGQGTRGFRPYRTGDDLSQIDWKLTARRDAYYVREPAGLEGGSPLIAVDLPAPGDPATFARFATTVYGAVEGAIRSREGCSLLVVAGGEVVRFLPRTLASHEALAALGGLAPLEPRAPLYRAPGPAALAARARAPGNDPGERAFREQFGGVLSAFAAESPSPFAAAVRAALGRAEAEEVRLFSLLPPGDKSHLVQLTHEAKVRRMRVILKAPAGAAPLPGVDVVEVL
ncbi:DUF58 domain-containing protein [Methanoculleus sp. YWC-01]|uniref:DUF58 domain-containing protein n=1 Tax=Methanoculleus nereidis TaxID=2735141 RepID=A0ABU3Z332_9EURY|nr:DUF58 domain-containing protein [Methanoculleus sp. YWC-01]MDV4343044.1 DUF58 domain-containing protein [Methanoculleus sp. YWC-01]